MQCLVRSAEFSLWRAGERLAQRRFEQLAPACADRRDAIALAIALAVDRDAEPGITEEHARERDRLMPAASHGQAGGSAYVHAGSDAVRTRADERPNARAPEEYPHAPAEGVPEASKPAEEPARQRARAASSAQRVATTATEPTVSARPVHAERRPTGLALHAGTSWWLAALPASALVFAMGLELPLAPTLALRISGLASTRRRVQLEAAHARAQLLGGELLACVGGARRPFGFSGCFGPAAGVLRAEGRGYARDDQAAMTWLAAVACAALRWWFASKLAAQLAARAHANVIRPKLRLDGSELSATSRLLGGSAGLELIVAFR